MKKGNAAFDMVSIRCNTPKPQGFNSKKSSTCLIVIQNRVKSNLISVEVVLVAENVVVLFPRIVIPEKGVWKLVQIHQGGLEYFTR